MQKLIGIAAGMLSPKKERQRYSSLYLNYGLLGLMTNLHRKGYPVQMFQGDYKCIDEFIGELADSGVDLKNSGIFLLSVPSFLSLEWAIQFAVKIKELDPRHKIIVGGRWVVDKNYDWVKNKFAGSVDSFSLGCPDEFVELFADINRWSELETPKKYIHPFYHLDYSLLHDFRNYSPNIEAARGCGFGCDFCLEKSFAVCPLVDPEVIFKQIDEIEELYGTRDLNFYFESSVFLPKTSWSQKFRELYIANKSRFKWRCTTRVDAADCHSFEILTDAGLKVVDFGLESASAVQLLRMNKTKNPSVYLEKAENILMRLSAKGVWAKLNILLYAGETVETYNETKNWLLKNDRYIKGISANPLTIYLNGIPETLEYCDEIESITGCSIDRDALLEHGFTYVDLSEEINISKAFSLCRELSDLIMTEDDYNDLKSITYRAD